MKSFERLEEDSNNSALGNDGTSQLSEHLSCLLIFFLFKNFVLFLAGVAQWIQCWPVKQTVSGSILSQGTCLGCGPGPQ